MPYNVFMQNSFDVVIVGGGAAGIMAALSVKKWHPEKTVAICEKSFELGRKLLVSGAGRCNLTNKHIQDEYMKYFHGDTQCISSVFNQFGYEDIIHFFTALGIPTYEEKKTGTGKMFPVIDQAKTIRDIFVDALNEQGVGILLDTPVSKLIRKNDVWDIETPKGQYHASVVILTTGGKTYPALGSDGSGYELAAQCGHTIVQPVVSAVPLVAKNPLSQYLQGERILAKITYGDGQQKSEYVGEVLFTQYGFSGPAILSASHDISLKLNRNHASSVAVTFSFLPHASYEDAKKILQDRIQRHSTLPVSHALWGLVTEKIAGALCGVAKLPKDARCGQIDENQIEQLLEVVTRYTVDITGTRGWNEAEFTAGGVDVAEVDSDTLESKVREGLYMAGEILDVDGAVGGFNLSWAWSSGFVAGKLQKGNKNVSVA